MKAMKKILCFITITVIFLTIISIRTLAAEEVSINAIPDKCPGDGVTIYGNTTFDIVSIKILYPNGDQYNVETVKSSSGSYSYTFKLPFDLPYGIYTVVAGKGSNVANTTFPVKQQDPGEEVVTINAILDKYPGDSV
ncbi:MAG: hypothetical protein PHD33_05975, partial [Atribacterota bacterium]|nr:hypothetical protein [Atribacterota bacterium]